MKYQILQMNLIDLFLCILKRSFVEQTLIRVDLYTYDWRIKLKNETERYNLLLGF